MEPKNFWKEMQRLCKQRGGTCDDSERGYDCPLCALPCCADRKTMASVTAADFAEMYTAVEKWSNANPDKTRQSEFLKQFQNTNLKTITRMLPCSLDETMKPLRCAKYGYLSITCRCDRCRDDYWNEEVDDN